MVISKPNERESMPDLWNSLVRKGRDKFADNYPTLMGDIRAEQTEEVAIALGVSHDKLVTHEYNQKLGSLIAAAAGDEEAIVYLIKLGASSDAEAELGIANYRDHISKNLGGFP